MIISMPRDNYCKISYLSHSDTHQRMFHLLFFQPTHIIGSKGILDHLLFSHLDSLHFSPPDSHHWIKKGILDYLLFSHPDSHNWIKGYSRLPTCLSPRLTSLDQKGYSRLPTCLSPRLTSLDQKGYSRLPTCLSPRLTSLDQRVF